MAKPHVNIDQHRVTVEKSFYDVCFLLFFVLFFLDGLVLTNELHLQWKWNRRFSEVLASLICCLILVLYSLFP